jgi:hypothetical protein
VPIGLAVRTFSVATFLVRAFAFIALADGLPVLVDSADVLLNIDFFLIGILAFLGEEFLLLRLCIMHPACQVDYLEETFAKCLISLHKTQGDGARA